jgi:ArsR family transcriptional regulator, arsenate/arsenite/antimonite-responsive transcriptional repressor
VFHGLIHILPEEYETRVELVRIYECLCDLTRLRLLNVLSQGPLCVCHFQEVLREPQVKISKHLGYLRARGLVAAKRQGNWMIYTLPEKPSRELHTNLACLQECARDHAVFQRDLTRLKKLTPQLAAVAPCGCVAPAKRNARKLYG